MFQMIKKELLILFRNEKYIAGMILIPIALTFLFSWSFSGRFTKEIKINETELIHNIERDEDFGKKLLDFLDEVKEDSNLKITRDNDNNENVEKISLGQEDLYLKLEIEDDGGGAVKPLQKLKESKDINMNSKEGEKIKGDVSEKFVEKIDNSIIDVKVYINELRELKGRLIEGLIESFTLRYKALQSISKVSPDAVSKIDLEAEREFVILKNVGPKMNFSALDYYSVAMTIFTIIMGVFIGAISFAEDRKKNISNRIRTSSTGVLKFYISKFIGAYTFVFFSVSVVFVFLKFVADAKFGENTGDIFLNFSVYIIFAVSFGIMLGIFFRSRGGVIFITWTMILLLTLLGGIVVPMYTMSKYHVYMNIERFILSKSMLDALFSIIYSNNTVLGLWTIKVSLIISGVIIVLSLLVLSSIWDKKRGDMGERNINYNKKQS